MATKKKAKASRKAAKKKAGTKKKAGPSKKAAKKPAKKKAQQARKAAPARKAAAKPVKAKKKAPVRKKKQIVGEGDYEASRAFLKDQAGFVKKNKAEIPAMGEEARAALEGSEGPALMAAEAEAKSHSKNPPEENN
jgi:hypothetical protein